MISYFVAGTPSPQGSMKGFVVRSKETGKTRAVITSDNGPELKDWRASVRHETALAFEGPMRGPVRIGVRFYMPQPASRRKERWPVVKPDLDKLVRSVLDALKGIAYEDDSQVVSFGPVLEKVYALQGEPTGARIYVEAVQGAPQS